MDVSHVKLLKIDFQKKLLSKKKKKKNHLHHQFTQNNVLNFLLKFYFFISKSL